MGAYHVIDITELAGRVGAAEKPDMHLNMLVDCEVYGRIPWCDGVDYMTIPAGEPDFCRRLAPMYMSSMDAAMKLLRPDQDFHRYVAYSGQTVMKIVGPSCDGYPCIGWGCTPAAGLVVARLRQIAAERVSQSA